METQEQGSSSQMTQQCLQLHIRTPSPERQNLGLSDRRSDLCDVGVEAREPSSSDSACQKISLSKRKLTELLWSKGAKSGCLRPAASGPVDGRGLAAISCEC